MSEFEILPAEGESYKGRQYGWEIRCHGDLALHATTGGTGPCWNLDLLDGDHHFGPMGGATDEGTHVQLHLCDLDGFIRALEILRDSEAHRLNVERWDV